jgi:hypothetical protein
MRRREFITLIGAVAAWPVAARAQQRERVRRVGVLMALAARLAAFLQGLQEYGWAVGRIHIRWAAGNADDIRKYAAELVALAPDVIPVSGGTAVRPLLQLTRTVPVVFTQTGLESNMFSHRTYMRRTRFQDILSCPLLLGAAHASFFEGLPISRFGSLRRLPKSGDGMKRCEFITLLGGAAAALSLAGGAQHPATGAAISSRNSCVSLPCYRHPCRENVDVA